MFKKMATTAAAGMLALGVGAASAAPVDLVFVIDRSGSMGNEGATLADRIGEVMAGIAADSRIDSVHAGVVSFLGAPSLVSSINGDAAALETAIDGISYGGGEEDGLEAMASVLPGGSLFNSIGWRPGTVRSLVLLTDEDSDDGNADFAGSYSGFQTLLDDTLGGAYLNNVIVSTDFGTRCAGVGGTATSAGCEYIQTSRPAGGDAAFDLIDFTQNTDAFLANFIDTKVREIVDVIDPDPTNPVPLPAAGWMLIAGVAGLGAMRRRSKAKS